MGEHSLTDAEALSIRLLTLPEPEIKHAATYLLAGKVQGVGLRKRLHALLDKHQVPGLAYNNARTGDVTASLGGDEETQAKILDELRQQLKNRKAKKFEPQRLLGDEPLSPVSLDDKALETMFQRQGFGEHVNALDPAAYRRAWAVKRYRLKEDPKSHKLTGDLPTLARQQLAGEEPIYESQLTHPQHAPGAALWNKPELAPIVASAKQAAAAGTQWTLAIDLDGTLAHDTPTFDPAVIGPPRLDYRPLLMTLHEVGARLIIWTCRGADELTADWLDEHDFPYDFINHNPDQPLGTSKKLFASAYLDDKAINAVNWQQATAKVLAAFRDHLLAQEPS